jgi:glycosyltransferase involved in cell wall biosynthesis
LQQRNSDLRLLVVIDSLSWGGAETLLADFASGAADGGIELSVAYLADRDAAAGRLRKLGIEPVLLPIKSLLGRADRRMVSEHVAAVAPDLVHTHLGYSHFHGGLAARSLGIPSVASVHVMTWEDTWRENLKVRVIGHARSRTAARVICVSDAARRAYLEHGREEPERVITVHNGIVGRSQPGAGARVRAELGIAPYELVVAMVSVLRRGKGHDVAAEAVAALSERFPSVRLLVLGEGPDHAEIEGQLAPLGQRALMTGHRDDVMDMLDAVDVVIHPSAIDAFPTALLEAEAAGVPAVATAVGGIPEIIRDGENGLLIGAPPQASELAEKVAGLLADPAARDRLGAAGRRDFEERFTVDRWVGRLTAVYDEVLDAHRDR